MNLLITPKKVSGRGFSLVETLVSLAIIMTAILGPMSIAQSGIQGARLASQNVTAIFLAQEAIEFVKYRAYTNDSNLDPFTKGLSGPGTCQSANGCAVDAYQNTVTNCSSSCPYLYLTSSGLYTIASAGNTQTPYTRQVIINGGGDEWTITVTVQWHRPDGSVLGAYTTTDSMFNLPVM